MELVILSSVMEIGHNAFSIIKIKKEGFSLLFFMVYFSNCFAIATTSSGVKPNSFNTSFPLPLAPK